MVTLDQIEQTILAAFHDPRVYFAIGRGAMGSGRLRSEAFTPGQLETQLVRGRGRVREPRAVHRDRSRQQPGRHELDLLLAVG